MIKNINLNDCILNHFILLINFAEHDFLVTNEINTTNDVVCYIT